MTKKFEGLLDIGHQFSLNHPGSRPDQESLQAFNESKRIEIKEYEKFIAVLTDFVNEKIEEIHDSGKVLEPQIPKYMKANTVVVS